MTAPLAPALMARNVGDGSGSVRLSWNLPAGATGIKVYRGTATAPTVQLGATLGAVSLTYDSTATLATRYFYRIKATNADGDSAYSNEVSVHPATTKAEPAPDEGNLHIRRFGYGQFGRRR